MVAPSAHEGSPRAAALQRKADLLRSLRLSTSSGLLSSPLITMALPASLLLTALVTKVFPLSKTMIGVFFALPFVANFLQIALVPIISHWKTPRVITVSTAGLHMVLWGALGLLLPWIPRGEPASVAWLLPWYLLSSLFYAICAVTWNSWVQEWVPPRIRGNYFGRRNGIQQITAFASLLATGWLLAHSDYRLAAFQAIILGAVFLRVFSLQCQWISPIPDKPLPPRRPPLAAQVRELVSSPSLLLFIAYGSLWSFAVYCFGPFYQVFMFEPLGFSAWDIGVVLTLAQLGGVLSLPAWGRLIDLHGNKSVMVVSLVLWQAQNLLWCFLTPHNRYLLYPMWAWSGATSAGFILGQFTLLLKLIPPAAKDLAIGFNLAATSIFAAVAPVVGGWLLGRSLEGGHEVFAVYHACFLLQPVLTLAGAFLLLRIREPAASPFSMVVGAMRNARTLSGVLGLSFLVEWMFFRNGKRRS